MPLRAMGTIMRSEDVRREKPSIRAEEFDGRQLRKKPISNHATIGIVIVS